MKALLKVSVELLLAMLFLLTSSAYAQDTSIGAFGSDSLERGTARVGFWDGKKNTGAGGFFIVYGKPVWKKDYEDAAKFDAMTKGRVWRLGSEYWTVLDSNVPLKVAGTNVPAGQWYLGLHRSQDGATWSLVFIDPAKVRSTRLDPSEIGKAPIEFKASMMPDSAGEMVEKLTLMLDVPKKPDLKHSMLRISWGKIQLKAPIEISL